MAQILTREHVEKFRHARMSRERAQIEPFLDDDVDWLLTGPVELLNFCGQRRGKAEVLDCLCRVQTAVMKVLKVDLGALLIDGDRAASFSQLTGIQLSTGRTISYNQAQFLRFRDSKIVEYRGIIDSFNAAEQMMGRPIVLPDQVRTLAVGDRVAV
jgi:ketosteroid isomerase-like protein